MLKRLSYDRALDRPSNAVTKDAERAELEQMLENFLQNGGTVQRVSPAATAYKVNPPCKIRGDGYLNGAY